MKDAKGSYTNPEQIASKFLNNFFTNIGPNLAKKLTNPNISYTQFLSESNPNSVLLSPTSAEEISSVVSSLTNSKSEGQDGICITPIKDEVIDLWAPPPLSFICNLSFSLGVFPDALKIAKILPVFKCDDNTSFSNYRPISILPCFSKILEKLYYSRLSQFLFKFRILNHHQYGFRQHHSTYMATLELVNHIYQHFENNEFTIGIFIDLKKAFDTVDHKILLDKAKFYGIWGPPLDWLTSYLSDRQQFVSEWDKMWCPTRIGSQSPSVSIIH